MTDDSIVTIHGPVARIDLAEPHRGSPLSLRTVAQLDDGVRAAEAADCRVVVIASAGRAFSVGGDISAFAGALDPGAYIDELASVLHAVILRLHGMDAIVISLVKGVAAGAGFPLAAAADLVLAGSSATFTFAYNKIGLTPDGGSSLLTSTLGLHRTLYLALVNPLMTALEAHQAGLVSAVYPDDEIDAELDRVVNLLVSGSRSAQVATKRLLRQRVLSGAARDLDTEQRTIARAANSLDGREGVQAFLDKRAPGFR